MITTLGSRQLGVCCRPVEFPGRLASMQKHIPVRPLTAQLSPSGVKLNRPDCARVQHTSNLAKWLVVLYSLLTACFAGVFGSVYAGTAGLNKAKQRPPTR